MPYKTIFIDWHSTLSNSRFWDRWAHDATTSNRYELVNQALFKSDEGKLLILDWMRGLRSAANILQYLHDMTGIPYGELKSELRYSAENMTFNDPTILDMIKQLRNRGVRVILATDNMDTFRLITVPALQLTDVFDGIIDSGTRGALKTDIGRSGTLPFFDQYLIQNQLQPGESVLIDDSIDTKIVENIGVDFRHVTKTATAVDHLQAILDSKIL